MRKYDAIIIGTGQAGPSLASCLAKNGWAVAIVEKAELGGTCVNDGCTPTKAYVASARRAYVAANSKEFGVTTHKGVEVDLKKIKARKDELIKGSREGLDKMFTKNEKITLIRGKASFVDDHTVEVGGKNITAEKIFINVGGRPRIPSGFEDVEALTNNSILELEKVPDELIIVGGGYVGLEFGQMFSRFGSKVTILEKGPQFLEKEDEVFSRLICEVFQSEGIEILLNSNCISGKKSENTYHITYDCEEGEKKVQASAVLLAAGRIPNTDDLGLENTGVELDENGFIKVNDHLQTTVPHIWALGDCNGQGAFTHTAYNDYQIVESQLLKDGKRKLSDRYPCYAVFIDPPLARVGMNLKELSEKNITPLIAEIDMEKVARAKEKGETSGKLKIYLDPESHKMLGATFMGVGADEYIHTIIDQMYAGQPFEVVRDAVHIHPTVSELIPTMLNRIKKGD